VSTTALIDLPANFRQDDVLTFHRRDREAVSEVVDANGLRKGVLWRGTPACLSILFQNGRAEATLAIDGADQAGDDAALVALVRRMLGLTQAVELFEAAFANHPQIGQLIARNGGLRLPVAASPFEAVSWAITGQQISVAVAVALRRRLIEAAAVRHSSGLLCYPDAGRVAALGPEILRQAGFSRSKMAALSAVAQRVAAGTLSLADDGDATNLELLGRDLLAVPGIGPWTVSYTLLRGFGWLDGSLHGDVAVRRGLQSLLGRTERLGEKETEQWLAQFRPWRALVGAHLWAWASATAY
jgi:DNA-3-methyladenine glycosylase II